MSLCHRRSRNDRAKQVAIVESAASTFGSWPALGSLMSARIVPEQIASTRLLAGGMRLTRLREIASAHARSTCFGSRGPGVRIPLPRPVKTMSW